MFYQRFQSALDPFKCHLVQLKEAECFTLLCIVSSKLPETYRPQSKQLKCLFKKSKIFKLLCFITAALD